MKTGEIWVFNHTKGESAVLVMDKIMSCNHTQGGDYWYAHCFDSLRSGRSYLGISFSKYIIKECWKFEVEDENW